MFLFKELVASLEDLIVVNRDHTIRVSKQRMQGEKDVVVLKDHFPRGVWPNCHV